MSADTATQVPAVWVRVSDTFTYRGRRYMRSGHGCTIAEDYYSFSVISVDGGRSGERELRMTGGVSDVVQGSYRPWAPDGNRHEGTPVTECPD